MSREKINCLTMLGQQFHANINSVELEVYLDAIKNFSDERVKEATGIAVRQCKFFPRIAEFLEILRTRGVGYDAQALLAFEELDRALSANDRQQMSPLTESIARTLGDWESLRLMPLREFYQWKRKDFLASFTAILRENPERVTALASPNSHIAFALKTIPSQEVDAQIEADNRRKLQHLTTNQQILLSGSES